VAARLVTCACIRGATLGQKAPATLSENGITLMQGSSDMSFTVAVPIPGIAK
jgi:hypothetical protein